MTGCTALATIYLIGKSSNTEKAERVRRENQGLIGWTVFMLMFCNFAWADVSLVKGIAVNGKSQLDQNKEKGTGCER